MFLKAIYSTIKISGALLAIVVGIYFLSSTPGSNLEYYSFASTTAESSAEFLAEGETAAIKNETVYVLLDNEGSPIDQRIINRIYDRHDHSAELVVDYGAYLEVENMISEDKPLVEEGRVLWNNSLLNDHDLYYEGAIDKTLPVTLAITYYLDGEEISAANLAGKSGQLDLVIKCQNNLVYKEPVSYVDYSGNLVYVDDTNYVPMLVQGTLAVDLNRFSDVEAEEGLIVITGQSAGVNFMLFPYPDAEIKISMSGEEIELDKITFVVSPKLPAMPEIDIEEELVKMLDGMSMFTAGIKELAYGTDQILRGLKAFQSESDQMLDNTEEITTLINQYRGQIENYRSMAGSLEPAEIAEMIDSLSALLNSIDNLPDGDLIDSEISAAVNYSAELARHTGQLDNSLAALQNNNNLLKAEAGLLIAENDPGSGLYELGILILAREEEIEKALAEMRVVDQSVNSLAYSIDRLDNEWSNSFYPLAGSLSELAALAGGNQDAMLEQLVSLSAGLSQIEEYYGEVDSFLDQAEEMLTDLSRLPAALDEMVYGQTQIRDGLYELQNSGIMAMEKGLIDGINESRSGAAKLELMQKLADDYRSYADNEHNRSSDVQFIMQTAGIKIGQLPNWADDHGQDKADNDHWSSELLARVINLFE